MDNNELQHHGIKGQKWGRRRFQNLDGSLTEAGEKRYNKAIDDYTKGDGKNTDFINYKKPKKEYTPPTAKKAYVSPTAEKQSFYELDRNLAKQKYDSEQDRLNKEARSIVDRIRKERMSILDKSRDSDGVVRDPEALAKSRKLADKEHEELSKVKSQREEARKILSEPQDRWGKYAKEIEGDKPKKEYTSPEIKDVPKPKKENSKPEAKAVDDGNNPPPKKPYKTPEADVYTKESSNKNETSNKNNKNNNKDNKKQNDESSDEPKKTVVDKKKKVQDMSDDELAAYNKRMEAEAKYEKYTKEESPKKEEPKRPSSDEVAKAVGSAATLAGQVTKEAGVNIHRASVKAKNAQDMKDYKNMTNAELKAEIERIRLENDYVNVSMAKMTAAQHKTESVISIIGNSLNVVGGAANAYAAIMSILKKD